MSVIADELHITMVIVVVRHYLSYRVSVYSAGTAGGVSVWMYVIVVPRMAITATVGFFQRFHYVSMNINRWDCLRLAKVVTQCLVPVNSTSSFPWSTMLLIS
jgi:hypothetical protein